MAVNFAVNPGNDKKISPNECDENVAKLLLEDLAILPMNYPRDRIHFFRKQNNNPTKP